MRVGCDTDVALADYNQMTDSVLTLEPLIRLGGFAGVLLILFLAEALAPRRKLKLDRLIRWPGNLGIGLVNTLVVRLILPASAVGIAALAQQANIGLLNQSALPALPNLLLACIVLDAVIYVQHRAMHRFPLLWRLHRMHHVDTDIDVTTALRFHPLEIVLSMLIKIAAIVLLGAPPEAVLMFEVALNACAMFNHANLNLPQWLDGPLRLLIVTPDMHRIHHSVRQQETNSNYGFSVSLWDRLFGTYTAEPEGGQTGFTTGLPGYAAKDGARIDRMLVDPLK
jgi:sterol desaturase/sphingolipid hydroxylase (fatty acid hydroxylase superfamily)